jgi:peroxiredoxin
MRTHSFAWPVALALFAPTAGGAFADAPRGTAAPDAKPAVGRVQGFDLPDARGPRHTAAEWTGRKAVVLFFLNTECPVSNGYAPAMTRLAREYGPRCVVVWGVHPDPDVTAAAAAAHAAEYKFPFPVLLDPAQTLARQAGVRVTPEAVLLGPDGRVLYRGRIDDRYALGGKRRETPRTHDLQDALDAVLAGRAPAAAETRAFGCPLPPAKAP